MVSGEEVSVESLWVLALVLKVFDNLLKSNNIYSSPDIFRAEFIQSLVFIASKGTGFSQQWLLKDLEVTWIDCRLPSTVFRVTWSNCNQCLITAGFLTSLLWFVYLDVNKAIRNQLTDCCFSSMNVTMCCERGGGGTTQTDCN